MTQEQIDKLCDFLYSSNDSDKVPFRLSIMKGQFCGWTLTRPQCDYLLRLISDSNNYNKEAFEKFLDDCIESE